MAHHQVLLALLAVSLLTTTIASAEGCDCRKLSLALAPVCGVDSITYINRCVAECQGVDVQHEAECTAAAGGQTLHPKASHITGSEEDGSAHEGADIGTAPTVDLSKADSQASVDPEVLTRYASTGFKFAAKLLLKTSLGITDPKAASATIEGQSILAGNRTLLAARVNALGHLYLKPSPASELAAAFWDGDSQQAVLPPRVPAAKPSMASQQEAEQGQEKGSRKLLLAALPEPRRAGSRGLLVTQPDDREEINTAAYPYSAVGLLFHENAADGSEGFCSGSLVGPRSVLTAGHCVYDTMARQFYDISMMAFIPNQHGGRQPSRDQLLAIQSVTTYFNNAGRPGQCDNGKYECQTTSDFEVDFAIITLEEPADEKYSYLSVGYKCGEVEYDDVATAGYPGDLPDFPLRMYGDSGALDPFNACLTDLDDSVVTSTLDTYHGQSGSGVWDSGYTIRALVNGGRADGQTLHRTIARWVFQAIKEDVDAASSS
ncbi:hypothetical protein N2152v2_000427 [Parachlorella kessleri]